MKSEFDTCARITPVRADTGCRYRVDVHLKNTNTTPYVERYMHSKLKNRLQRMRLNNAST